MKQTKTTAPNTVHRLLLVCIYLGATSPGRAGAAGAASTNDGGSADVFLTSLAASEALADRLASACGYASADAMVAAMRPALLEKVDPASSTHVLLVSCTSSIKAHSVSQLPIAAEHVRAGSLKRITSEVVAR